MDSQIVASLTTSSDVEMQPALLKFLVGTWFLYDSFQYCTQPRKVAGLISREDEWVHYATGLVFGDVHTIERMVTFPLKQQSSVYVEGDPMATRDVLIQMSEYGYALHAVCHSHPGHGAGATYPSGIDLDHQDRLERGGYPVVSCIYSRDGFARFFTVNLAFEIEIYGRGVENLGENVFHLTESC